MNWSEAKTLELCFYRGLVHKSAVKHVNMIIFMKLQIWITNSKSQICFRMLFKFYIYAAMFPCHSALLYSVCDHDYSFVVII